MVRFTGHFNLITGHADYAVHQADRNLLALQHRPLFNMQLQISRCFLNPVLRFSGVAAGQQRLFEGCSFRVLLLQHGSLVELARQYA
ncbi:hypothetical protein D3C81_2034430 [compost metagenome]